MQPETLTSGSQLSGELQRTLVVVAKTGESA
jgi:hypothetical protein